MNKSMFLLFRLLLNKFLLEKQGNRLSYNCLIVYIYFGVDHVGKCIL